MKLLIVSLLLVASTLALDVAKVRPIVRTRDPRPSYNRRVIPKLSDNSGRIIGGTPAAVGQFPYQVGLFIDGSGFCGGSLISDTVVLTAAHCAVNTVFWDVHVGATNINDLSEPGHTVITTRDGTVHEEYGPVLIHNDIAVLRLPSAASGPNVGTIALPSRSDVGNDFVDTVATLSGWGKTSDGSGISDVLNWVELTVITNAVCDAYYGSIVPTIICVGTAGGTASSCNGDSGGPLVAPGANGVVIEIGIVSFGSSAGCQSGAPAAFTRVTEFLDWIATNTGITIQP